MRRVALLSAIALTGAMVALVYMTFVAPKGRRPWRPGGAPAGPGPLAAEIVDERRRQQAREVAREYGRVFVKVRMARLRDPRLAYLEPKLARAMELARAGRYRDALFLINLVEARVPLQAERVRPAAQNEGRLSVDDAVPGAPVRPRKGGKVR